MDNQYPFLSKSIVQKYIKEAEKKKVSVVARSLRGFTTAYLKHGMRVRTLTDPKYGQNWSVRRNSFIARHLTQMKKNNRPLFNESGEPTRQHLALILWAYSPTPSRL